MQRNFDEIQLGTIELFCQAAELGSFTAAANQSGVTPAAVSRSIARLEERLGVRLFVRTTRQIRLTDGGQRYYEQCREALDRLLEAERSGVAVSAIHFYEAKGLIRSRRNAGNQRRYTRDALRRVAVIKVAQRIGVPL
eukprot:gene31901-36012_t